MSIFKNDFYLDTININKTRDCRVLKFHLKNVDSATH